MKLLITKQVCRVGLQSLLFFLVFRQNVQINDQIKGLNGECVDNKQLTRKKSLHNNSYATQIRDECRKFLARERARS